MAQLRTFGDWGVILIPKGEPREAVPDSVLNEAIHHGFRYFKYMVVRDAQQKMSQYSFKRCPGGFPIMTALVVSQHPFDPEDPKTLRTIKDHLQI